MSFTVKELEEAIEARNEEEDDFWYFWGDTKITVNGVEYTATEVTSTGGMDEGSSASVIFKVDGRYFRKNGFYQSHYGYDWDGEFGEVEPFEKTVTSYRSV